MELFSLYLCAFFWCSDEKLQFDIGIAHFSNSPCYLQQAAKQAASAATQLINAAGGAGKSNRNQASQQQLMTQCKVVADDVIPRLIQGLRATMQSPENANSLIMLITAAQDMMQVGCTNLVHYDRILCLSQGSHVVSDVLGQDLNLQFKWCSASEETTRVTAESNRFSAETFLCLSISAMRKNACCCQGHRSNSRRSVGCSQPQQCF